MTNTAVLAEENGRYIVKRGNRGPGVYIKGGWKRGDESDLEINEFGRG